MDTIISLGVLVGLGYLAYKAGKQIGSRKGYSVGRGHRHGRH